MTQNTENMQVSGMVGARKSPALIRHLAQRSGPGDVVWAIDAKAIDTDAAEMVAALNAVVAERRALTGAFVAEQPALVVDECQAILADPAVAATVADLIRLGCKTGFGDELEGAGDDVQ